jgi:cytoplasmic iron level regulating protein YaaA (DUF328/UPF0246 family)
MCRGAMSRWIIQNRITDIDMLKTFEYEGFKASPLPSPKREGEEIMNFCMK